MDSLIVWMGLICQMGQEQPQFNLVCIPIHDEELRIQRCRQRYPVSTVNCQLISEIG